MTPLERAAADLREAEAELKAHTPKDVLEKKVAIAKEALISAARTPPSEPIDVSVKPTTFNAAEVAAGLNSIGTEEPAEDSDSIFEETEIPAVAASSNVAPVKSAAMQDVVESVTSAAETIDATEEVSDEDVAKALA